MRLALAGWLMGMALLAAAGARAASCPEQGEEAVAVARLDERLGIVLADGRALRLAGLDVPDAGRGDPETTAAARAYFGPLLVGRPARLHIFAPKDRWGRLVGDLFVVDAGRPVSVADLALAAGFARVRPEPEARACLDERLILEDAARADGLGVWTDPYYAVRQANDRGDLKSRDGQFVIVEGVIRKVGEGRGRVYADFGGRADLSLVAPRRRARDLALAGVRVRVRGALDERFGIRMDIVDRDQIERLDAPAEGNKAAQ
jgi:endonuclease YncB( thermonuclease family)